MSIAEQRPRFTCQAAERLAQALYGLEAQAQPLPSERDQNEALEAALAKIKTLRGLLPICAHCKKIRDDEGYWQDVAIYIGTHSEAEFSHGICPDCAKTDFADYYEG